MSARNSAGGREGGGPDRWLFIGIGFVPILALAAAFLIPYAAAVSNGIGKLAAVLAREEIRRVLGFTVRQASLSTLAALAVGLPGAWLVGSGRFRGAKLVRAVASVPFAMPPILVVLGFVLFFGNGGWINRSIMTAFGLSEPPLRLLYSTAAIIAAHAFYNFPIVLRFVGDAIAKARMSYAPAAAALGASPAMAFLTVLLPIALPSIAAAALLVFLYCFTSFAVVLVLGGGPGATTLPVEIYRSARISLDYGTAGALALLETLVAAGAYAAYSKMERRIRLTTGKTEDRNRERSTKDGEGAASGSKTSNILSAAYLAFAVILVVGPIVSVVAESFLSRTTRAGQAEWSLRWWTSLGAAALPALGRSLLLASAAATVSVMLAAAAALSGWGMRGFSEKAERSRWDGALSAFCTAPLASSGIVLGLGWLALYGTALARSFWAVVLAHAVSALPFAYRSVAEGLRSLPERTAAASATLGASPVSTAFRIALPSAARRIGSAWAFAAAISLGELNAVLMLGLDNFETLPLLIYRAAGAYRFGTACAAGVLLALSCVIAFTLSEDTANVD